MWVPEENIVKSILNLISSAIIHNKIIDIRVSKDTLNKKKLNEIFNYSPNFSNFKITYEKNSYLLNYKKINSTELNKIIIFFSKKKKYKKSLNLKKKKSSKKVIKIDKKIKKLLYFKNISTFKFIRSKKELIKNNNYDYIVKNKYYGLAIKLDAQENQKLFL